MTHMYTKIYQYSRQNILYLSLVILGVVYVLNAWSPSSYGVFLETLGLNDLLPTFGSPRPIRSDEWAVQTPLTQALVNNNFERFNLTSVYGEDLRINYGLPIFDWGMVFKPALWGYLILPPAYAFSLYYYLLSMFFIIGYMLFLEKIGSVRNVAFLFACALYYSGAIQFWWGVNASTFAYFPWVMITFISIYKNKWNAIAFCYFLVAWQLGNLYPPFTYGLCLSGLVWLNLVFVKKGACPFLNFNVLIISFIALLVACFFIIIYYYDYIVIMRDTFYPGRRSVSGQLREWKDFLPTFLFPSLLFQSNYELYNPAIGGNISHSSTWATLLPLVIIFFAKINLKRSVVISLILRLIPTIFLVSIVFSWLLFAIPSEYGKYILINNVNPNRLMLGAGLIISLISYGIFCISSFYITATRCLIFSVCYFAVLIWHKPSLVGIGLDLIGFLIAALFVIILNFKKFNNHLIVMVFVFITSSISFGFFNPLQDSRYIFNIPKNSTFDMFNLEIDNKGFISFGGAGATFNGAGYKSIAHVLPIPQVSFWKKKFPDISKNEIAYVFNRYAHIQIHDGNDISLRGADIIFVPRKCFMNNLLDPCYGVKIHDDSAFTSKGLELMLPEEINLKFQEIQSFSNISPLRFVLKNYIPISKNVDSVVFKKQNINRIESTFYTNNGLNFGQDVKINNDQMLVIAKVDFKDDVSSEGDFNLLIKLSDGEKKNLTVSKSVLKTGIIVSHYYEEADDLILMFSKDVEHRHKKIASFSLSSLKNTQGLANSYDLKFESFPLLDIQQSVEAIINQSFIKDISTVVDLPSCDYVVDKQTTTDHLFSIRGWIAKSLKDGIPVDEAYVSFTDKNTKEKKYFLLDMFERTDVAVAYSSENLKKTGYGAQISIGHFSSAPYLINILFKHNNIIYNCMPAQNIIQKNEKVSS